VLIRALIPSALFCLASIASADGSITVEVPNGDYALFATKGAAPSHPADMVTSKGGTASVPLPDGEDHVYVWDRTSDDLAVLSAKKLPATWKVKTSDFKDLDSITVSVDQDSKPVAAAEVAIDDKDPRHSEIVDASGPATLFDVKAGTVSIDVRTKGPDGKPSKVTETFTLPTDSPKASRALTIALAPTATAAAATAPTTAPASGPAPATQPSTAPKKEPPNPVGVAIGWLIALGFAGVVIYFVMNFMRKNPGTVGAKLAQLGVQVPQPGDQGLSTATPINTPDPIRPQPVQKIVLQDAAPDPIVPMASVAPVAVQTVIGEPSLVSESGVAIPLVGGETIVGREPGLGLSLSAETTVSRRHATLARAGQEVTLTDLGSSNGTFVNGAKLQSPVVLRSGDAVQFGSARFTYRT
jgi:hypothetical protein